jgi:L-alanine-DL-glutamate epimerase-like enolase superfamily enzyme
MTTFGAPLPATLTIDRIITTPFRLPLFGTLQWGKHSALSVAHHVLVEVILSDGSRGLAEAPPRPTIYGETVQSITSIIATELMPRLQGQPVVAALNKLHEIKNNQTAKGALDMAIHAAVAQHHGVALAVYLGATTPRLRVSYILGIGERDTVLAEAQRVFDQGVRVLKVKVGRDWQNDLALIDELRLLFGDTMLLYADANETLHPAEAATILRHVRDHGLAYCEEPLPVELIRERAALRHAQLLPLIADDSCFSERDLIRELALDTFDVLNIKTARTGYTESHAMVQRARAAGKGIMVGSQASTGLGTMRAALFAARPGIDYPSELSFFLKLQEDILTAPLQLHDGDLVLADLEGITVDPALLAAAAHP